MDGSEVDHFTRMCKLSDMIIRKLTIEHEQVLFDHLIQQLVEGGAHGEDPPATAAAE
jgi:hypothetical protein